MRPPAHMWIAPALVLALLSGGLPFSDPAGAAACPPAAYLVLPGGIEPFCEVGQAVDAAPADATIAVAPRVAPYREALTVRAAQGGLTLCPALSDGSGCTDDPFARPVIDATGFGAPALTVHADRVTVLGLGFQGATPVVRVSGAEDPVLDGLRVTTQTSTTRATDGIHLIDTARAQVLQSEVSGNLYPGSAAIRAERATSGLIEANSMAQSGTAIDIVDGQAVTVRGNEIAVTSAGPDAERSVGLRFLRGDDHRTDNNRIDGVGVGILASGSVRLALDGDTVRSVPVGIRIAAAPTADGLRQPVAPVLRDLGLAGADTALRITPDVSGVHIDAACNDWGAYTTSAIGDTRIRDEGAGNTITYTPYKAYTSDGLACLRLPTAAFTHDPAVTDRLTDVRFTSDSTAGTYPIMAHHWDLGDGTRTSGLSPAHRYSDVGTYTITLTVTDTDGMKDSVQRDIVVQDLAPALAPISDAALDEGASITVALRADDPEGDTIDWSLAPHDLGATIEPTGPATADIRWDPDHFQAGLHMFTVRADDGYLTTQRTWNVTVHDVDGPPRIDPVPVLSVREGETLRADVHAEDPDGAAVALALFVLPPGALFTDHGDGTGTFEWTPGFHQAGERLLTLQASDGALASQAEVTVQVEDVNRPPVLAPLTDQTAAVGATLSFVVSALDPDGDPLSIDIAPLPPGAAWDADARRFEWRPDSGQAGQSWQLTATATDTKGATDAATFSVDVAGDVRYGVRTEAAKAVEPSAVPGTTIDYPFVVENTGTTTRTYALTLQGVPLGWDVRLPATTLTLQPGERQVFGLEVVPDGRTPLGRFVLHVDDGLTADTLTFHTQVPMHGEVTLTSNVPTEGFVRLTYSDGTPVKGQYVELIERKSNGGAFRTTSGTSGPDGLLRFSFGVDPLGAGSPGDHKVSMRFVRLGGNSWDHDGYRIEVLDK